MGGFMALTALPVTDTWAVADAISRYAARHGVLTEVLGPEAVNDDDVATVSPPHDGWSVMAWPTYFVGLEPAALWLSAEFGAVSSAMTFYDGDFWMHVACERGEYRDQFASMPGYFAEDPDEVAALRRRWAGSPATLSSLFGRPVDEIAPYLVEPEDLRAFPDDTFTLDDPWVFVDFWRRLGITYPDPAAGATVERCVRFLPPGSATLPSGGPGL
jgi:hypothetical protein